MALSRLFAAWSTGATSVTRRGEELDIGSAPWAGMLLEVVRCHLLLGELGELTGEAKYDAFDGTLDNSFSYYMMIWSKTVKT